MGQGSHARSSSIPFKRYMVCLQHGQSITAATDHPVDDTTAVDCVRISIDEPPNSDGTTNVSIDLVQEPVDNATSTSLSTNPDPA
jgi:hypothetical protein